MTDIRKFDTGATRDAEDGKLDFEGFLSPLALEVYGQYMNKHRVQPDGKLRASDNWQKGIPADAYMKSHWRHFFAVWKNHRGYEVRDERDGHLVDIIEALCGDLFNAMGRLDLEVKRRMAGEPPPLPERDRGADDVPTYKTP